MYKAWDLGQGSLFCLWISSCSSAKRLSFFHWIIYASLPNISCRFSGGQCLSFLFCSLDLSLTSHTVLIIRSMSLKSSNSIPLTLFFFFKTMLAILLPLSFHINVRIILSISTKYGVCMRTAPVYQFGKNSPLCYVVPSSQPISRVFF